MQTQMNGNLTEGGGACRRLRKRNRRAIQTPTFGVAELYWCFHWRKISEN